MKFLSFFIIAVLYGCTNMSQISPETFIELYNGEYYLNDYYEYDRIKFNYHILNHYSFYNNGKYTGSSIPLIVERFVIHKNKLPNNFPNNKQKKILDYPKTENIMNLHLLN